MARKRVTHPGFGRAASGIARRQKISKSRAYAILAAGARKASKRAIRKNPRLKRVSGVVKRRRRK